MGAWSESVFGNDVSEDWCDQFEKNPPTSVVTKPINQLIKSKRPSDELCIIALTAAEVIAASRGNACRDFPSEIRDWIRERSFQADDDVTKAAIECVERVRENSELAELWEYASTWKRGIDNLVSRLQLPTKKTRLKKSPAAGKSSSRPGGFSAAKKEIERLPGCLLTIRKTGEMYFTVSDRISETQLIELLIKYEEVLAPVHTMVLNFDYVTDATARELHRLPNLESLYLDGSKITDAALEALASHPGLHYLSIVFTKVTDAGLMHLTRSQLYCVAINKTRTTDAGIRKFQQLKPDCFIGPSYEWSAQRVKHAQQKK